MSVQFWQPRYEGLPDPADREHCQLAQAIIEASDPMPEPDKHIVWLLGLKKEVLQERLRIIQSQGGKHLYRRADRKSEAFDKKQKELAYA